LDTIWREQFERFSERKTQEAGAATLYPYATEVDSPPADDVAIGNAWTRQLFGGSFYVSPRPSDARPACSLVFVQSRDGNTVAPNPSDLGGGETDKHLIYEGLSRVAADAVMAGAGTVRHGNIVFSVWHHELVRLREALGKPRHPVQIVATLRGLDIGRGLLFNVPDVPVIVVTSQSSDRSMLDAFRSRPWITPVVMDDPSNIAQTFEKLRTLGMDRISVVGGRRLAGQLLDADLVQDVYLTTSPRNGGEPNTPFYAKPLNTRLIVRKLGSREETGVIFEQLNLRS
jgi:5-amino-6-(5-phosphoribosylamino)uracil reductase